MSRMKLKEITYTLFGGGLGFATSSVLGLDGFRESMQLSQLVIGMVIMLMAVIGHLWMSRTSK